VKTIIAVLWIAYILSFGIIFAEDQPVAAPVVPVPTGGSYGIIFDGEISSILGDSGTNPEGNTNFSNASFGIFFKLPKVDISALVRVVDAQKNRTTQYAFDLFNYKGSDKLGGIVEVRFKNVIKPIDLKGYLAYGSNTWILQEGSFPEMSNREFQATVTSFGIHLMYAIEDTLDGNDLFVGFFAGGGFKSISGNIGFQKYDEIREALLGSVTRLFLGFEGGMVMKFNSIKASLLVTNYGGEIENFSRTRLLANIGIEANVLRLGKK
jgi:hypothetical protein